MKILLVVLTFAFTIFAQNFESSENPKFNFYGRGPYRQEVPRPQEILRYEVGDFHTTYAQMEKVITEIAKSASDRVRIFEIGMTNEYRMMYLIAISAPENIARLEQIKANNARLTDPRKTSPQEASSIIQNNPLIVWLAYTIHGNESASFEAMMQVVYQLAASNEPATLEILRNIVVLIIPCENPDGHERFVTWYNSTAMGNPDRDALEHREPWSVQGRYNRYRFDLNRDNLVATQIETQNLQKAFFEWNPQVVVDHHGQPSQYFFPPAALPINPNLPQPVTNKWMDIFGKANASSFDAQKWDYYVRDIFDLFYPGYWDSFPSLNGATGMTYETDGGGFKGLRWERDDGSIVTLHSAIAKHFVASMTTLETASKYRRERLQDFYDFRKTAMEEVKNEKIKRIIILPEKDRIRAAELAEALLRMKIEIGVSQAPFTSKAAYNYMEKNSPATTVNFPSGVFIIDLNQPQKRLIKALLEPETLQDKEFIQDQMARFKRNQMRGKKQPKEEYGFYDITAWSLPLAFGLDAFWTEDSTPVRATPLTEDYINQLKSGSVSGKAQIAYIFPYDTDLSAIMALRLLNEGFRVGIATKQIEAEGKLWKRGTFVVRVTRNPESVHKAISRLANELGVRVTAVNTGFFEQGDSGVGSETIMALKAPKIAMLGDEGIDHTSFGSIWWTLDRYKINFTALSASAIRRGALKRQDVLIIPDGSPTDILNTLGKSGVETIKSWVQSDGTLITIRGASVFASLKDVGLTTVKLVGSEEGSERPKDKQEIPSPKENIKSAETSKPVVSLKPEDSKKVQVSKNIVSQALKESGTVDLRDKQDRKAPTLPPIVSPSASNQNVPESVPGAIMKATADLTTPLTYGLEDENLPVLLASSYFFHLSKEGTNAIIFKPSPEKPLTISGFVWEGNTEKLLQGTAYLISEPFGEGNIIIFAENPLFRGFFRSMTKPFLNSILLSKSGF